jgi:type IV pilus assembly protein PilC
MFADLGTKMPGSTRALMAFSSFIMSYWYLVIIGVVAIIVIITAIKQTPPGKRFFGKLALKLPIFGDLNRKSQAASFARTMSTLVSSGMGITAALDIAAKAMSNVIYSDILTKAKEEVEQGIPLSVPIRKAPEFPSMVNNMLAVGEESGNIENMLVKVAEYFEEETEQTTANLTTILQPAIIVLLGGIVGWIVLSLYQPMISMYGGLGNL